MKKGVDKPFLIMVITLLIVGFLTFISASLGLLANNVEKFKAVATNQFLFGVLLGTIALFTTSHINFKFWKSWSLVLFVTSILLTLLVFIPGIGFEHGGARRWISIAGFSFQPSEALKIGYILYLSAFFARYKDKIKEFKYGLLPFMVITGIVGFILLMQPDTDTFLIMGTAGLSIFFVSGGSIKDICILFLVGLIGLGALVTTRPYLKERLNTFINPHEKTESSGYQIKQSLIAIGSGGLFGKGFGQSTQKFGSLPEPIGDSIFAVLSEEFGFIGSTFIVILFVIFAMRGLKIASKTTDHFGGLVTLGIVIMIVTGSFINISAMLGIIPLSGTPLLFISHGGTALFMTLAQIGIILNISKTQKT